MPGSTRNQAAVQKKDGNELVQALKKLLEKHGATVGNIEKLAPFEVAKLIDSQWTDLTRGKESVEISPKKSQDEDRDKTRTKLGEVLKEIHDFRKVQSELMGVLAGSKASFESWLFFADQNRKIEKTTRRSDKNRIGEI